MKRRPPGTSGTKIGPARKAAKPKPKVRGTGRAATKAKVTPVRRPRGERTPRRNAEERRVVGANAEGPWDDGRVDRGPDKGSTDHRERQPALPKKNYDKDWGDDDLGGRTDPSDVK